MQTNYDKKGMDSSSFLKPDGGKTKSNAIEVPTISLPKGGGAIKGIDEKFSVNAINGTASISIPLPLSPARGCTPSLSLSYNSGAGNGIFGLGWNLNIASIKRKTDKGLPQYLDTIDSDTFLFSEAEDLVAEFKKNVDGSFTLDQKNEFVVNERDSPDGLFTIRYYKPRIEGLFARIERWTEKNIGRIKWRVITRDNTTTLLGWTDNSIISNPDDPLKIYEWLPEFIFDDKGNCSQYTYKKEDEEGVNDAFLHNRNRLKNGLITYTNLYISKLLYGNKTPYTQFGDEFPNEADYLFQTIFDYGTLSAQDSLDTINKWSYRQDAFSEYKSGFEIRTTRLCKRVLLFHVFDELALKLDKSDKKTLIKSLNFEYDTTKEEDFTFLKCTTNFGYIKKPDGSYTFKKLPPMEFEYQKHDWSKDVKTISPDNSVHAPTGLDEEQFQFIDLFNEGLSGILTEQANGWYYKHNLGDGKFDNAKLVSPKPSFSGLGNQLQLVDLDADGGKQLASLKTEPKGYFELSDDNLWLNHKNFEALPNFNLDDPNIRMIDLTGDGKADLLITEDNVFLCYESTGRNGFVESSKTTKAFEEEAGPNVIFANPDQSIFLADMNGDGMTDIVRIRNGEVCYWPNMGYGKFGGKIGMDNAPIFDHPDSFNPSYIRLADIDGSGTTDIIYLGKNRFSCWKNLSGNLFSKTPFEIESFPELHNVSKVTVTDLLGNGVACIVWSSQLSKDTNIPLKYIDLMNSKKPHIMVSYKNNLGKEVKFEYTPSTKFYIDDKLAGKPWVTKLHFPVHCISKTITEDKISGYRFVNEYKYHHGYYDHAEREFRGFGMVEQIDTETFEHWKKGNASNIVDESLHQEPVVSKTWNHTGAFLQKDKILNQFAKEYWFEEMIKQGFSVSHHELSLPDAKLIAAPGINTTILNNLSTQEWREAFRACKGMVLRTEVFAKDAVKNGNSNEARKKELTPFSVATHNCIIELIQPKGKNKHAVFIVKESEAITYNYERNAEDPRIAHNLNLKLDEYGNVLESASVVYQRLTTDASLPIETQLAQSKTVIIYTQNQFTNDVLFDSAYRLRLPSESKTFELKGVLKSNTYYTPIDFKDILSDIKSDTVPYHETDKNPIPGKAQKRLLEQVRSLYYSNNLTNVLALHQLESLALPFESYQLAYTSELVTDIFGSKVNTTLLTEGKFTNSEGDNNWWIRSGTTQFKTINENNTAAKNRFYSPISYTDPYGAITKVKYYGNYFLFIDENEDALGNKSNVLTFNFRTLSPKRMKDINGNFSEVICDELGFVKAVAVLGKGSEADELTGLSEITDITESVEILEFFETSDSAQLTNKGKNFLKRATSRYIYSFEAYTKFGKPAVIAAITREQHFQELNDSPVQISFEYSNGIGEVLMKKVQAEPGRAKQVIINTDLSISVSEINTDTLSPRQLRWIGNGRTIKNNKGNPVKQYEPYFSLTPHYEDYKELVETGVTPILYYDAAGRLTKTDMPDGTFSKVEFDSWKQIIYDANDTVLQSSWYINRSNNLIDVKLIAEGKDPIKEKTAADKAAKHANTPNTMHFDTLGRAILSIENNRNTTTETEEFYLTKTKLDTEGNLRSVTDARGNIVMQYKFDMLGNEVYQQSMDAGQRWKLMNILGNPLRTWDERNHEFQYFYDTVHRPIHSKVIGGDGDLPLDNIFDRIVYGESLLLSGRSNEVILQSKNILGKTIQHFDTGGLVETEEYDFKGQPRSTTRKLFSKYKELANWTDENLSGNLEVGAFIFTTKTDALGRITQQTAPDGSIITPSYNEAGLLNGENVLHPGDTLAKVYIKDIDYNEKGQRNKIIYGNDVTTRFYYDLETFRLNRLESKRQNGDPLQDWYYTFDPVGNVSHIEDKNIPTTFFNNQKITGISEYTYDALYQLIEATGRENNVAQPLTSQDNWNDSSFIQHLNPGDLMAMRTYTQNFQYDSVGNMIQMRHQSSGNSWTREYSYQSKNNRLISTQIGDQIYQYPHHAQHGFITAMPHLEEMHWNFQEGLFKTIRQRRTDGGTAETTYYQYDCGGKRIRKITENQAAPGNIPTKKEERIYISGYELYKKHSSPDAGLERISLSLMDQGHRFVMIETRNDIDDGTEKQLVRYQLHNHLGSSSIELNEVALVISYEEYHPYGTTAFQAKNTSIKSTSKRYRYTGMERDEETGLEYHSARYYLPWLGRWLSGDPIGIKSDLNIYLYASNHPLNYIDTNGKDPTPPDPNELTLDEMLATITEPPSPIIRFVTSPPYEEQLKKYEASKASAETKLKRQSSIKKLEDMPSISSTTDEQKTQKEFDEFINLDADSSEMYLELRIPYSILSGIKHEIYNPISERVSPTPKYYLNSEHQALEYTGHVDHSDAAPALANLALLVIPALAPTKATLGVEALDNALLLNRSKELGLAYYEIAPSNIKATLSLPKLPVTFSTVSREGITVINVNNPTVYKSFLQATEEGTVLLRPNEFVGSPPIRSGSVLNPQWKSKFLHSETQGELELRTIFDLDGIGTASSYPNPGCGYCVPWIKDRGITHTNPAIP